MPSSLHGSADHHQPQQFGTVAAMLVSLVAVMTSQVPQPGAPSPNSQCLNGPCFPGNEFCAQPFINAPKFHLMDQHGCAENDPNGPVFDPVHGVIHHFYQIHLAATPGHGPDYGRKHLH